MMAEVDLHVLGNIVDSFSFIKEEVLAVILIGRK